MIDFSTSRLQESTILKAFDCGESDLNKFLMEDSKNYLKRFLSVTYILSIEDNIIAYFSLSNDKISVPDTDKSTWRRIKKSFPHAKHRSDYPAVKIGRLAVDQKFQNLSIGTSILDLIKHMFVHNNRTGCAFITVDALPSATSFYLKNDFKFLDKNANEHENKSTQTLYYDLSRLI